MVETSYVVDLTWNLLLVVALVLLNGFFVAAEFAIVKVRESRLRTSEAPTRAAALHVVGHLDAYLSACQLGITIASLALGWIGEPAISHLIVEPTLGRWIIDPETVRAVSFGVAFFIITALHIVIGELAPKTIAIRNAEATALWVSVPLRAFRKLFSPLIWVLNGSANLILRSVGIQPAATQEAEHTVDELRLLLAQVKAGERTERRSARIASRVFGLQDIELREIMTSREKMVYLDIDRSFEENFQVVRQTRFTRFPLTDGGPDSILGFIHQRDMFDAADRTLRPPLEDLRRDILVAPAGQHASTMLSDMLEKRVQIAVVVDEHGITLGMVTLEDVLEEFVGDIPGEFDKTESRLRVLAPGRYVVDAGMPVRDFQVVIREPIEVKEAKTLAGLLNERFGRIPQKGDTIRIGHYEYSITDADVQRAKQVEVRRVAEPTPPAPGGEPSSPTPSGA